MMPERYIKGSADKDTSFYFSIGDHKYTVKVVGDEVTVEDGKTIDDADVVLKATPELFKRMVIDGKLPGAMDIAMGRIKTNDPNGLRSLKAWFKFD